MPHKAQLPQVIETGTCDTVDMLRHRQLVVKDDAQIAYAGGRFNNSTVEQTNRVDVQSRQPLLCTQPDELSLVRIEL